MDDLFEIPVWYKGEELFFTARLVMMGYVHKFRVEVDDQELFFEQDDNGEYRVIADYENMEQAKKIDVELLKAIASAIETILR
ncbi:MAG: hypothetical protein JWP81_4412 [Ferruginibacter sp.]|nr:hypothetical protein [Ferruginibacter sp.]